MLILTRKIGQSIKVDNDIELVILAMKGSQVRLGINAPKEVPILRKELWEKDQKIKK